MEDGALRTPASILREIDRLYHLLPAYDTGKVSPELLIKEAEIRSLVEQFKAANEAIYTRWVNEGESEAETPRRRIA
jgi:hypothetical protein